MINKAVNLQEAFRKPREICFWREDLEQMTDYFETQTFIREEKRKIEQLVEKLGCRLRLAVYKDSPGIRKLLEERFRPPVAAQISIYDLYRCINYGYTVVIDNPEGEILGFDISSGYDDREGTSFGIIVAIDNRLAGNRLGALISSYTSLLGMERNGRIRRGIILPTNEPSMHTLVNRTGFLCEQFLPEMFGPGEPRFILAFPLSPGGICNNAVDIPKALNYIAGLEENTDYRLIRNDKLKEVEKMYKTSDFRVCAFIPRGKKDENAWFLAFPKARLNFPPGY